MFRPFSTLLGTAVCTTAALILELSTAPMAHGHGGGHGGGGWHGGAYHGGIHHGFYGGFHPYGYGGFYRPYHGYGFYRPYYGYGFGGYGLGLGLAGFGLGYGLGSTLGGYGLGGSGVYAPYYGGYGVAPSVVVVNTPSVYPNAGAAPAPANNPPPDNAAHLQLVVPENAEVLFGGEKTNRIGPIREYVSPPLPAGEVFTYKITVRYPDANGKLVEDKRAIRVRANDWFRIDFTRPAPPEQPSELPRPRPGAV